MWSKEKAGFGVCMGCLLVFFAVFFNSVYEPQQQAIVQKKSLLKENQKEIVAVKNFLNEHSNLSAYESELSEKEGIAEKLLPKNMQISLFIRSVETFAQKHKIFLFVVKPDVVKQQDELQCVAFSIEFYGDYFSVLAFLQEIERMQPFTCVKKLTIRAEDDHLDCKMIIETYAKMKIEKSNV
jgi:Pilus assembly protein, PilO.